MNIRAAKPEDSSFIEKLLIYMSDYHHGARPDLFKGKVPKFNKSGLLKLMKNKKFILLIAEKNDIKLGYLIAEIIDEAETAVTKYHKTLYIHDLCVDTNYRSGGVGSLLLKSAENHARESGCGRLLLNVYIFDGCAENFYEKFGFKTISKRMEYNF